MNEESNAIKLLVEPIIETTPAIIKAIGVGGGGGNAVSHMYHAGIEGVRFLACNTDSKALEDVPIPDHLQLGPGLGAGGKPELGRQYALESTEQINKALDKDVKMVFITAGMGGGTGTGASPIIAHEAKKRGILTVGVVTIPFIFEGRKQIDKALDGLDALSKEVDALLVINNERLRELYASLDILSAFKKADETLTTAVRCIVEIITMHGRIDLDFRDVNTVLRDGGVAVISEGYGEGDGRVTKAIEQAIYSPLLNNNDVYRSRKVIFCLTISPDQEQALRMEEMCEIDNFTAKFRPDVETKWGLKTDPTMGDRVKVTILASGFHLYEKDETNAEGIADVADEEEKLRAERRERSYPELLHDRRRPHLRHRPKVYLFGTNDLDDESIIAEVEAKPTAQRSAKDLHSILAMAVSHSKKAASAPALATVEKSVANSIATDQPITIDFSSMHE